MTTSTIDYANRKHWLSYPTDTSAEVDVFYFLPTGYTAGKNDPCFCDTQHPEMQEKAKSHLLYKASLYEDVGNLYVPYYEQMSIDSLQKTTTDDRMQSLFIEHTYLSMVAAFEYFLKTQKFERPFILAAHSQGSLLLLILLSQYLKDKPQVLDRMVCAYAIGFSVTKDYLHENSHLKFASGETDTGCIISYNTEMKDYDGLNLTLFENSIAINPVNWRLDERYASNSESLGSRIPVFYPSGELKELLELPNYADAQIDLKRGTVRCSTADPYLCFRKDREAYFPLGILHSLDLNLYYYDLRENAKKRSAQYLINF